MNKLSKTVRVALVTGLVSCALFSPQAQATFINGTIDFAGSVMFDSSALQNVTEVLEWRDVFGNSGFTNVAATSGDFTGILLGTQATMATPWIFTPSTGTPGLWSVGVFTYDLMSSMVVSQTATFLHITGTGTVSGTGFDPTQATWDFKIQNAGGGTGDFFSFSAQTVASGSGGSNGVPDSGSTIALMLGAVGTLIALRQRLAARS